MGRSRGLKFKNRPKIETSRPKLSTPRPRASIFSGFKVGSANWARRASKFVLVFVKNGPVAAKLKSRPRDRPKNVGREFQIFKLRWISDRCPPQNAKVVYPPPPEGQITGIEKCVGKMEPRRPLIQPLRGSTPPKMGHFGPKKGLKQGHSGLKRGSASPKPPQIRPFLQFWRRGGGGGQKRPISA